MTGHTSRGPSSWNRPNSALSKSTQGASTCSTILELTCAFFFQAEDGIRDHCVTGVQTCALPISTSVSVAAPPAIPTILNLGGDTLFTTVGAAAAVIDQGTAAHVSDAGNPSNIGGRSEEHTSELQSHSDLVCRLLLEKKKHDIVAN